MGRKLKPTPLKFCKHCDAKMERKNQPSGSLEGLNSFNRRVFCSARCFGAYLAKTPKTKEEAHTRARQIKKRRFCNRCNRSDQLQVHHMDRNPFNNARTNLEVLCVPCHRAEHQRKTPTSICAVCSRSFIARSHRNRNKICSAPCAKIFGRISALKRWYPE